MTESTLGAPTATVVGFVSGDSPELWAVLVSELDRLWRSSYHVMFAAGVLCVHSLRRSSARVELCYAPFLTSIIGDPRNFQYSKNGPELSELELTLCSAVTGTILRVFLKGQAHDYTIYCLSACPEAFLEAIPIAEVMES